MLFTFLAGLEFSQPLSLSGWRNTVCYGLFTSCKMQQTHHFRVNTIWQKVDHMLSHFMWALSIQIRYWNVYLCFTQCLSRELKEPNQQTESNLKSNKLSQWLNQPLCQASTCTSIYKHTHTHTPSDMQVGSFPKSSGSPLAGSHRSLSQRGIESNEKGKYLALQLLYDTGDL